MKFEGQVKVIF